MKLPAWIRLVKGSVESDDNEPVSLMFCDNVGVDLFGGISSSEFGTVLEHIPAQKDIKLLLNTVGGYVHEGLAIYNMIRTRGNVDVCVIGYAASMGAVILQAGRRRSMMAGTMVMIHDPFTPAVEPEGNMLNVLKENLVDIFAGRTGIGREVIAGMMTKSTAMGPEEAVRLGFCDTVENGAEPNEFAPTPETTAKICNALNSLATRPAARGGTDNKKETKKMKALLSALAAAKIIPCETLEDDAAAAAVNVFHIENARIASALAAAEEKLQAAEDAQRERVTQAVEKAIADGLVKAERKDKLIELGMRDEAELTEQINDLAAAKEVAARASLKRGAPPVPHGGKDGEDKAAQIDELRLRLREPGLSPVARAGIAVQLRELRGHGKLFVRD